MIDETEPLLNQNNVHESVIVEYPDGRDGMNQAVERQQKILTENYLLELRTKEEQRSNRLSRYIELLSIRTQISDPTVAEEFISLAKEFYIPRNADEEGIIMDAGGSTYGV